jgi:hypothetical protein
VSVCECDCECVSLWRAFSGCVCVIFVNHPYAGPPATAKWKCPNVIPTTGDYCCNEIHWNWKWFFGREAEGLFD